MFYDIIKNSTEFSRDFEVDSNINANDLLEKALVFLQEEIDETKEAVSLNDKPEIVDGFGDVAFVAINGIYKEFRLQGNNHELAVFHTNEVMKRICEANLGKKQKDGTIKYLNGKVQKPIGWTPPVYDDIITK